MQRLQHTRFDVCVCMHARTACTSATASQRLIKCFGREAFHNHKMVLKHSMPKAPNAHKKSCTEPDGRLSSAAIILSLKKMTQNLGGKSRNPEMQSAKAIIITVIPPWQKLSPSRGATPAATQRSQTRQEQEIEAKNIPATAQSLTQ